MWCVKRLLSAYASRAARDIGRAVRWSDCFQIDCRLLFPCICPCISPLLLQPPAIVGALVVILDTVEGQGTDGRDRITIRIYQLAQESILNWSQIKAHHRAKPTNLSTLELT